MPISLLFRCGGCDTTAVGTAPMRRRFVVTGQYQGLDIGRFSEWAGIEDIAPKGWIASDPFTGCCYCPACWESIVSARPVPGLPASGGVEEGKQ